MSGRFDDVLAELGSRATVLDRNHFYRRIHGDADTWPDVGWPREDDRVLVGIMVYHRAPGEGCCGGMVSFARPLHPSEYEAKRPLWHVVLLEPLTLTPSILCRGGDCGGDHGFITAGAWVPA